MKALSQRLPFSAVQVLVQDIAVKPEFGKFTLRVVERIEVKQIQQRLLTRGVGCRGGNVCKGAISNFNPSSSVRPYCEL